MKEFQGHVPVPGGVVSVEMNEKEICVKSDIAGGVLCVGDARYPLEKGVGKRIPNNQANESLD